MSTIIQNFYKATITRNWSATTGDLNVSVKPTTSSGWLVVSPNNSTLREIIYFTATGTNAYGDFITVADVGDRGLGGTTAQTHTIGESVRMNITAQHWDLLPQISSGIIAPATTPDKIGLIYVDTVLDKIYISSGTASSADWRLLN